MNVLSYFWIRNKSQVNKMYLRVCLPSILIEILKLYLGLLRVASNRPPTKAGKKSKYVTNAHDLKCSKHLQVLKYIQGSILLPKFILKYHSIQRYDSFKHVCIYKNMWNFENACKDVICIALVGIHVLGVGQYS